MTADPILVGAAAVPVPAGDDQACCVYAEHVLEHAYGLPPATGTAHAAWRLYDVSRPWSPVEAAAGFGLVESVTYPPAAPLPPPIGRWALVQGWRGTPGAPGVTGHTVLLLRLDADHVLQVDDAIGRPPAERVRTWASVVGEFVGGLAVGVLA